MLDDRQAPIYEAQSRKICDFIDLSSRSPPPCEDKFLTRPFSYWIIKIHLFMHANCKIKAGNMAHTDIHYHRTGGPRPASMRSLDPYSKERDLYFLVASTIAHASAVFIYRGKYLYYRQISAVQNPHSYSFPPLLPISGYIPSRILCLCPSPLSASMPSLSD